MVTSVPQKDISLYCHIPFCQKKCHYCHFYVIPDKDIHRQQYLIALKKEWERWRAQISQHKIVSIYFGGGTPSLIGAAAIADILSWIYSVCPIDSKQIEITLEANPENITYQLMHDYAHAGINRVSIGIQTLDDRLLLKLGRIHSANKAMEAVHETFRAGIENITIDLMYDLPCQDLQSWEATLNKVIKLPIKHISLYNLTVEPHTVFFKKRNQILKEMPDEETSLHMYEKAIEVLEAHHFKPYEISAFSQANYHSCHNSGYWTGRSFIGLGPSAFSYWEGKRFSNAANLNRYSQKLDANESPIDFEEKLDPLDARRELLAIQLRLMEGVNLGTFQQQFGLLDAQTLEVLQALSREDYIRLTPEKINLTKKGILFYDTVASEIV
jgi:oxygen-independent coproporphyrinogen-3 oxidase